MIERAGYDLLRFGLRIAVQLWPLWLFWWAWDLSYGRWEAYLLTFPTNQPGGSWTTGYRWALRVWPTIALLGPALVMAVGVLLHRLQVGSRAMGACNILAS